MPSSFDRAADPRALQHLRWLGWLLDSSIPLPGGYRIGWDGIIGLLPGIGDAIGASLGGYIVIAAARLGAPPGVVARMTLNVLVETLVGTIPVVGDLFDLAFKANVRNLRLLERSLLAPEVTRRRSAALLWGIGFAVVAVIALAAVAVALLVAALGRALFG